ncbi:MAG: class I SAM-dependent methyltransferase [Spirochaetales bacterium]|nr:class I SAM-dependent methyltransferase [Spirochaetales bacterium]
MNYFDKEENVRSYIRQARGYDGRFLIEKLNTRLKPDSTVLEIGMGPGKDLDILGETYRTAGSDRSEIFLNLYRKKHPHADLLYLDAVTLETERKFDALYSNKVLHCLSYEEMALSFRRQADLLTAGGLVLHSFWYGEEIECYEGEHFCQVNEEILQNLRGNLFEPLDIGRYGEMEKDDSLYALFRLK